MTDSLAQASGVVRIRHQVTIAGQVLDSLTQRPIPGATVKIVEAPDKFFKQVLVRARLVASLKPQLRMRSPQAALVTDLFPEELTSFREELKNNVDTAEKLSAFHTFFEAPPISSSVKWDGFELMLNDAEVVPLDKFKCFQFVLDFCSVPLGLSRLPSERTQTAIDGWFHFLDLPDGHYTLKAALPPTATRYGITSFEPVNGKAGQVVQVTYRQDKEGKPQGDSNLQNTKAQKERVSFYSVPLYLVPTTLAVRITDTQSQSAALAKVQIGGKEFAVTFDGAAQTLAATGFYLMLGVEPPPAPKDVVGYYMEASPSHTPLRISVIAASHSSDREAPIPTPALEGFSLQPGEIKRLNFQFQSISDQFALNS